MGITVINGGKKVHKIIEAGTDCGRGKDPETSGMILEYESDNCDSNTENDDDNYNNNSVDFGRLECEDATDNNNELINAAEDSNNDINNRVDDTIVEESIDSSNGTEAVNQIVTQISGSTIAVCQWQTLMTLLVTILIIQQ